MIPRVDGTGVGLVGATLFASVAGAFLVRSLVLQFPQTTWGARLRRYQDDLRQELLFVRASLSAEVLLGIRSVAAVASVFVAWTHLPIALGLAALAYLPGPALGRARRRRVAQIEAQVEGWLGSLARSLEAAPSLGEAVEVTVAMTDAPMREELEVLVNEMHLGRPLGHALDEWGRRVGSRTLNLALSTLQVGREAGGRLGEVLKSTAASLREMERLEGVIRAKTAEGKAQALVISVVPLPLYAAVKYTDPHYFVALESTSLGNILLAVAAGLWIAAGLIARKVLAVQI